MRATLAISVAAALAAGCGGRAPAVGETGPGAGRARSGAAPGPAPGAITGVVRDQGTGGVPLSFVELVANAADSPARGRDTSNYQGRYRIDDLPPGPYRLEATFAEMRVLFDDVLVRPGAPTRINVDFDSRAERERAAEGAGPADPGAAPETGVIYGRIVDQQSGEPFPGAVVTAFITDAPGAPTTIADHRGHYRIGGLRPATYTLSIYYQLIDKGAIEVQRRNVEVEAGGTTRVDLQIDTRVKR